MTDRVPTPGKEGRVKLTFDDESVQYAKIEMADEPTQEGTPLIKTTLLSDETAALYEFGAEEEPTVDAALRQLPYRVGDTLTTARTNLGNNWRLCNGAELTRSSYPDLSDLFSVDVTGGLWKSGTVSGLTIVNKIVYANGYWVALGYYESGDIYYARICYKTSITAGWTTKDLWSGDNNDNQLYDLIYNDGYYIAVGQYAYKADGNQGYTNQARVAYATTINGTYTFNTLWSSANYNYANQIPRSIAYGNGYYVVCGTNYNYGLGYTSPYIAYSTSVTGSWKNKPLASPTSNTESCGVYFVVYANGYWVACGDAPNSTSNADTAAIYYATTPNGTWTQKTLFSNYAANVHSIVYSNGYWVTSGVDGDSSTTINAVVYYTSNLTGTWTKRVLEGVSNAPQTDIINDGTYFVVMVRTRYKMSLWYRATPTGTFTEIPIVASSTSNNCLASTIVFADNIYLIDGGASTLSFTYNDISKLKLPSISLSDDTYTYIKVLE